MTAEQVKYLKEQLNKANENGKRVVESVFYDFDNNMAFRSNGDFIIFDDENQLIHCISANRNNYVKDETPFSMITSGYEHLQFTEANLSIESLFAVMDDMLSSLLTDDQKNQIKKWANNLPVKPISPVINTYGRQPAPWIPNRPVTKISDPDGTHESYPIFAGGQKDSANKPVKTITPDKIDEAFNSLEENATIMLTGSTNLDKETNIEANGATIIGSKDSAVTNKLNVKANNVTIKGMRIDNCDANNEDNKGKVVEVTGDNFSMENCQIITTSKTRNAVIANSATMTIKDTVFDGADGVYNALESSYGKAEQKKIVFENCTFKPGCATNNFVSFYDFVDGAEVEFNNCSFLCHNMSNPVRISNNKNSKVTITFNNCRYGVVDGDSIGCALIIFQGSTKTNTDMSKVTVKINNLRSMDGKKKFMKNVGDEVYNTERISSTDRIWYTYEVTVNPNIIFS